MIMIQIVVGNDYDSDGWFRERPFNLKGGGGYGFFLKKIF
jgi:hypothetical protein